MDPKSMDQGMSDPTELIDRYVAMWNETDAAARRRLIALIWVEECVHVDPVARAERHEGIDGLVQTVQQRFPGHRFRRTSPVTGEARRVRFTWELAAPDGTVPVRGIDDGTLAADGRRLQAITAAFEPPGQARRPLG